MRLKRYKVEIKDYNSADNLSFRKQFIKIVLAFQCVASMFLLVCNNKVKEH
jgi:hypothetical protein